MAWLAVPLWRLVRGGEPRLSPGQALDDGGLDQGVCHVPLIRDGIEKRFENSGSHPVPIPLEDGIPRAKGGRRVAPRAAGPRISLHPWLEPQCSAQENPKISTDPNENPA